MLSWAAKSWFRHSIWRKRRNVFALVAILGLFPVFQRLYYSYFKVKSWLTYDPLWSYTYVNASATVFPPHDPIYILFEPRTYATFEPSQPLQKVRRLLAHCRDDYFAKGVPCHASPDPPLDVVWTWANGSDRLFQESLSRVIQTADYKTKATYRPNTYFFRYVCLI